MKYLSRFLALVFLLFSLNLSATDIPQTPSPEYLQSVTVLVDTVAVNGTGCVFIRKDSTGTNNIVFIWTAGHLVKHTQDSFEEIFSKQVLMQRRISLDAYKIFQNITKDGTTIGKTNVLANVVKFSDEFHDDIGLLMIDSPFYGTNSIRFDLSEKPPKVGIPLRSVTCPYSLWGSYSEGVMAFVGRAIRGNVYDQTTCLVYKGSSGGPIFSEDGKCIGLVSSMTAPNMNYIVPARRLVAWAKKKHLEWALNPDAPIPSKSEIKRIVPEDPEDQTSILFLLSPP